MSPFAASLELGRFVLTDPTPANAESWFLGQIWSQAAGLGVRGVVSFADPMPRERTILRRGENGSLRHETETLTPGHVGLIYQAANGYACGRSTPRTLNYLPARGEIISERRLSKIRLQESGAEAAERQLVAYGARPRRTGQDPSDWLRSAMVDLGVVKIRHPGNFRYAWRLGSRSDRRRTRIAQPRTSYPKPATDVLSTRHISSARTPSPDVRTSVPENQRRAK